MKVKKRTNKEIKKYRADRIVYYSVLTVYPRCREISMGEVTTIVQWKLHGMRCLLLLNPLTYVYYTHVHYFYVDHISDKRWHSEISQQYHSSSYASLRCFSFIPLFNGERCRRKKNHDHILLTCFDKPTGVHKHSSDRTVKRRSRRCHALNDCASYFIDKGDAELFLSQFDLEISARKIDETRNHNWML